MADLKDYPPVPPGCMMFDPRRLRRHYRSLYGSSWRRERNEAKRIAEAEARAERVAAVKARLSQHEKKPEREGIVSKVARFFSKRRQ